MSVTWGHMFISDGCFAVTRFVAFFPLSPSSDNDTSLSQFLTFSRRKLQASLIFFMHFVYIRCHIVVVTTFASVRSLGRIISCHIVCVIVSVALPKVSPQCVTKLLFLSLVSNSFYSEDFSAQNDGFHLLPRLLVYQMPVCLFKV